MSILSQYIVTTERDFGGNDGSTYEVYDVTDKFCEVAGLVQKALDAELEKNCSLREYLEEHPAKGMLTEVTWPFWNHMIQTDFGFIDIRVTMMQASEEEKRKAALEKARMLHKEGLLHGVRDIAIANDAMVTTFDKISDNDINSIIDMIIDINHRNGDMSRNMQSFAEAMNSLFEEVPSRQKKAVRLYRMRNQGAKEMAAYQKYVEEVVNCCYAV